jgi:DNA polymerase eta
MPAAAHRQTLADRIVLLIDLDCFYAQCECIRLGYDSTTTPLVLLQWNSVLAVTYPARELYNIKRGDGWDEVRRKSNGKCLTVHVPMLSHSSTQQTTSTATAAATSNLDNDDKDEPLTDDNPFAYDALDKKYDEIFKASDTDKEMARTELGVRRFSHEGKACIERYRIASRQIFSVILEYLGVLNKELKQKLVMERASIDELFFDVSGACFSDAIVKESDEDFQSSLDATKIIGQEDCEKEDDHIDVDAEEMLAFRRGIVLASRIRKHVRDKLNFTMTAGVGHNKTVAKLSATYGKPNGQAVTFPYAVKYLLSHTEIRKCRNFGGKLGKRVLALLPEGVPTTMGSIAQYLSLPELEKGLGEASLARWVYQAVRGTDTEAVVAKEQSLIKSITAFKSLPFHADGIPSIRQNPGYGF